MSSVADREGAVAALFARLQTICDTDFAFYSRAYVDPSSIPVQPALLLVAERYNTKIERGKPNVWFVFVSVLLFCKAAEGETSPETQMNGLINSVENALQRQSGEPVIDNTNLTETNLGGLVSRVSIQSWVAATGIELMMSVTGQSAAIIPVEIMMTVPSGI